MIAETYKQEQRKTHIRALNAVAEFRAGKFDDAINTFIDLDFNPAKVVALYPENVAGRLSVSPDKWLKLYGGSLADPAADASHESSQHEGRKLSETYKMERSPSPTGSIRGRLRTGFSALLPGGVKEDDTASISSQKASSLRPNKKPRSTSLFKE